MQEFKRCDCESELEFHKQVIFKLETDIQFARFEKAQMDLDFLKEMKDHAIKAFEKKDVSSYEMLLTMINDWIDELENV